MPPPIRISRKSPPRFDQRNLHRSPIRSSTSIAVTRYCGADRKLTTDLRALTTGMERGLRVEESTVNDPGPGSRD